MDKDKVFKKIRLLVFDCILLVFFVFFDQLTKNIAVKELKGKEPITIIQHVLELQYLENRGAAFGVLQNQKIFFVLIAVIILAVIINVLFRAPLTKKYRILHILLVLIASGAIGNMIDRLSQNYVVDFIYFSLIHFPIFNVADIYVTCSTIGLILVILFYYKEDDFRFLSLKQQMIRETKYTENKK